MGQKQNHLNAPLKALQFPKSILWALLLKCPLCGQEKLKKSTFSLEFNRGCPHCRYSYEREPGYFWGQSMMISYPIIGSTLMIIGGFLVYFGSFGAYQMAGLLFAASLPIAFLTNPHSRVIWMLIDLYINPLGPKDQLNYETDFGRSAAESNR